MRGLDHALGAAHAPIDLVAGASNVTGEVWPLARRADIAHRHGAQLFVDAAQLSPHRPIDMARGHRPGRLLRPRAVRALRRGALVGDFGRLASTAPLLRGGGAITLGTLDDVMGTTIEDIDRLTDSLDHIVEHGPATRYRFASENDEYQPADRSPASRLAAAPLAVAATADALREGVRNGPVVQATATIGLSDLRLG